MKTLIECTLISLLTLGLLTAGMTLYGIATGDHPLFMFSILSLAAVAVAAQILNMIKVYFEEAALKASMNTRYAQRRSMNVIN